MTQEELAEKLNVNNCTISRWENGKNLPDVSLFNSLCEELGIIINELLCGEKYIFFHSTQLLKNKKAYRTGV